MFSDNKLHHKASQSSAEATDQVESPDQQLGGRKWFIAVEPQHILETGPASSRDYPRNAGVAELFGVQAAQNPGAVASVEDAGAVTYGELERRANQLARYLVRRGLQPGTLVGVCVERSAATLVALLGILKAGGAYVPLDPDYPVARLEFMVQDTAAPLIVTLEQHRGLFAAGVAAARLVCLDALAADLAAEAVEDPRVPVTPEMPVYVMYTSGSTGQPKGVVIPQKGVVRLVCNPDYVTLGPREVILHNAPLAFDASTFEIWGALLNGGCVALLPAGPVSLTEMGEAIRRHGVTTLWLTAGLFHLMVEERLEDLRPLRQLLAGGDVLSPEKVRKVLQGLPDCRLINGYGPTENTTFTCCHTVTRTEALAGGVPIGRPVANTTVLILDEQQQPVAPGEPGELYTGGDGLALGYWKQPELTAERFVPNPFGTTPGDRLYKTGDRCRHRADGIIEFLGRMDQQVKIRGFRIEPGEIETALASHPAVSVAAVIARSVAGGKELVGYVVWRRESAVSAEHLRTWLAGRLPDHLVPARIIVLPAMPLTANGKVDRAALAVREEPAVAAGDTAQDLPRTPLEGKLAGLWAKVLGREKIALRENFFELGGNSLSALQLAVGVEKLLAHPLPIAVLFQAPTVELLARWITDKNWAPDWSSIIPLKAQGTKPPIFFVHAMYGDVFCYLPMAKLLPEDQPGYGIQAAGIDGRREPHKSFEEMAAHYARELCSFLPTGAFCLVGFSMGGVLAYEIACQLRRLDRQVALVGIIDNEPMGQLDFWPRVLSKIEFRLRSVSWRHRQLLVERIKKWWHQPATGTNPDTDVMAKIYADPYVQMSLKNRLKPFDGSVEVLVTETVFLQNNVWGWKYLAGGGVRFYPVVGEHLELLKNPATVAWLVKMLERAQASAQK